VQVVACDIAEARDGYDWQGQCTEPIAGALFALRGLEGDIASDVTKRTTGENGRLRFERIRPGTYSLTRTDGNWCHAESDGVDDQGNVVIEAGQLVSVWIFVCTMAK
jgi:hypothetical protein